MFDLFSINDLNRMLWVDKNEEERLACGKYIESRRKILEEAKKVDVGVSISSIYQQKGYTIKDRPRMFSIVLSNNLPQREQETIFLHESAHIRHDSFDAKFMNSLAKVANDFIIKNGISFDSYQSSNIKSMHHKLANSLEDTRIESRESLDQYGIEQRFNEVRKSVGEEVKHGILYSRTYQKNDGSNKYEMDPVTKYLAIRFFNHDLFEDQDDMDYYIKIHEQMKYQSHEGMLAIFRKVCKEKLHPWLEERIKDWKETDENDKKSNQQIKDMNNNIDDKQEQLSQEISEKKEKAREKLNQDTTSDKYKNYVDDMEKIEAERKERVKELAKLKSQRTRTVKKARKEFNALQDKQTLPQCDKVGHNTIGFPIMDDNVRYNPNESSYDDSMLDSVDIDKEQQRQHSQLMQEIRDNLKPLTSSTNKSVKCINDIVEEKDLWSTIEPNVKLQAELRRSLDNLTMVKNRNSYVGQSISLNGMIKYAVDRDPKVFQTKKDKIKLSVLVAIDASGSMSGEPLNSCASVLHDVMTATKNNPFIEVKTLAWTGGNKEFVYRTAESIHEIPSRICLTSSYGGTPTINALEHVKLEIAKLHGKKKLTIFLTDGDSDEYFSDGKHVRPEEAKRLREGFIRDIKQSSLFLPIFVHLREQEDEWSNRFKHKVINTIPSELSSTLYKNLRNNILRDLK